MKKSYIDFVAFVEFSAMGIPVVIVDEIKKPKDWQILVDGGKIYSLREEGEILSILKRKSLLPVNEVYTREERIHDPKESM
jgi:hypothetical protein